mgnify:FL=1|tara:strand:+ start:4680 stop:5186 length:507 start_codon:yes stop_codon:yes gene_type:complete
MYSFKKYFALLSIFFISFSFSFLAKNQTSYLTGKEDSWKNPPIIVNCYYSLFENKRIKEAAEYWDEKGFEIAFYESKPIKSICKNEKVEGIILIKIARYDELEKNTLAFTRRYSSYGNINSATIYIEYGVFSYPNLLEHELGHALGLKHVEKEGHIMHPIYDRMGREY